MPGFRLLEREAVIGRGDAHWSAATSAILRWEIKTRSGFRVEGAVEEGADVTIIALGFIREPVRVVYVIDEPDRCGYAYGTRRGHPLRGEELFVLERRGTDTVLRIRSFSRPAGVWWLVAPVLRTAQYIVLRRYLVALKGL